MTLFIFSHFTCSVALKFFLRLESSKLGRKTRMEELSQVCVCLDTIA